MISKVTSEIALEFLSYNEETGNLIWKKRDRKWFNYDRTCNAWNARFSGTIAGNTQPDSSGKKYRRISIFHSVYLVHRVIYLMKTGFWPEHEIDHIDGNGCNNKWNNIRNVTSYENSKNSRLRNDNKSGTQGVNRCRNKWQAEIQVKGEKVYLGQFFYFIIACAHRKQAEINYGFHKNHGVNRPL